MLLGVTAFFVFIVVGGLAAFVYKEGKLPLWGDRAVFGRPAYVLATVMLGYVPVSVLIILIAWEDIKAEFHGGVILWAILGIFAMVLAVFLVFIGVVGFIFSEDMSWEGWRARRRQLLEKKRLREERERDREDRRREDPSRRRYEMVDDEDDDRDEDDDEDDDRPRVRRRRK